MTAKPSPQVWIVVPTYWGPADGELYGHPTPLDGESTLPALLGSLSDQSFSGEMTVLVLAAVVTRELESAATARVAALLEPFAPRLQLRVAAPRHADQIERRLGEDLSPRLAGMMGYGPVRNMQLLIPALLGAQIIVALDDDEVAGRDYLAARGRSRPKGASSPGEEVQRARDGCGVLHRATGEAMQ